MSLISLLSFSTIFIFIFITLVSLNPGPFLPKFESDSKATLTFL